MYRRIIAVGDIHGMYDRFQSVYHKMDYEPERDFLIFLGDYIDRGPDSVRVLDWMLEHAGQKNVVMLRGNHEQMLLDYADSGESGWGWLLNSGLSTLQAMKKSLFGWQKYPDFVRKLPCHYEIEQGGQRYFFAHAGVNPAKPLEQQTEDDLLWVREEYYNHYTGEAIIVGGHTPVQAVAEGQTTPILKKNLIMLDTGSFLRDGHISAIDVLTREFWQSD